MSPEALPDGWRYEKCNDKYCVWFDEKGKRYKSGTSLLRKVDVSCGISFDLYENRNEIGQVKHRFPALTAHKYKQRLSAVQNIKLGVNIVGYVIGTQLLCTVKRKSVYPIVHCYSTPYSNFNIV